MKRPRGASGVQLSVPRARLAAIVFDCGDTLIGLRPARERICQDALAELGLSFPLPVLRDAYRVVEFRHQQRSSRETTAAKKRAFLREYNHSLSRALGAERHADRIDRALQAAFAARRRWRPMPGARAMLEALEGRLPLFVLANWSDQLSPLLHALDLLRFFDGVHASQELGAEKPDPAAYAAFVRRTRIAPARSVYLGNDYAADVVGSRNAGFQPVLFDRARHYLGPVDCARVTRLRDFLTLVEPALPRRA